MVKDSGLRERKKAATRSRIAEAALGMFAERGFDHVPVAEIARAADVSEATVFNYFPTKEDLVFGGMQSYESAMLAAIDARAEGTGVAVAFRDYTLTPRGALASDDGEAAERVATAARVIAASPALQARERRIIDRAVDALAAKMAEAGPGSHFEAWVEAHALMGVNRAMIRLAQRLAAEGLSGPEIGRQVVASGRAAFDRLLRGFASPG